MANLKSSKKDIRRTAKRRVRNQNVRTALKTHVKNVRVAIESGDAGKMDEALNKAAKNLDKAAEHGVIHKNQASRRKSRIASAVQKAKSTD